MSANPDPVLEMLDPVQQAVAAQAAALLATPDWVILDVETTGLDVADQVIQVVLLLPSGRVLLDTLIEPTVPIEPEAQALHGLGASELERAPIYPAVHSLLCLHLEGAHVVAYSPDFTQRMLEQTAGAHDLVAPLPDRLTSVMDLYTCFSGSRHYVKLPGGDHSAAGDARAILRLLQMMAGYAPLAPSDEAPLQEVPS